MYSIGQFLCTIQTNRWASAFCASLEPGFLVGKRGKKSTIYILYCRPTLGPKVAQSRLKSPKIALSRLIRLKSRKVALGRL